MGCERKKDFLAKGSNILVGKAAAGLAEDTALQYSKVPKRYLHFSLNPSLSKWLLLCRFLSNSASFGRPSSVQVADVVHPSF